MESRATKRADAGGNGQCCVHTYHTIHYHTMLDYLFHACTVFVYRTRMVAYQLQKDAPFVVCVDDSKFHWYATS